jgi:Xaa-Pro aminopeptidase
MMLAVAGQAQTFDAKEFRNRRDSVCAGMGDGIGFVFAGIPNDAPLKFRQAPDFYYLTGIEEPYAILVLVASNRSSFLFVPKKSEIQIFVEGPGILEKENAASEYGLSAVLPLDQFWPTLSYIAGSSRLYLPLTPLDNVHNARDEARGQQIQMLSHPLFASATPYQAAVDKLRAFFPEKSIHDINPLLDRLRWVKTEYEIGKLRLSGKIGAEGVREAIKGTRPGMYEYELEAVARYYYVKRGARGDAFSPIVASGPNTATIHYQNNRRQIQANEVVLMDSGCDYDYYTSDITRVWPSSGKFSADEEKMYACILEARQAIIGAMKPGVTINQLKDIAHAVYVKHGFAQEHLAWGKYVGHTVGISVHDVTPYSDDTPLVAGVVFNVEPVIGNAAKKLHMRLEDTVVITPTGAENLTADVPVELKDIYDLVRQKGLGAK